MSTYANRCLKCTDFKRFIARTHASWPGEKSCRLYFTEEPKNGEDIGRNANRTLIFEPALGGSDAKCSCDTVEM